jgi:hypothetical protein
VLAELIGEARFRLAPLTDVDAAALVHGGKAGRLRAGSGPPAAGGALVDLLGCPRVSGTAELADRPQPSACPPGGPSPSTRSARLPRHGHAEDLVTVDCGFLRIGPAPAGFRRGSGRHAGGVHSEGRDRGGQPERKRDDRGGLAALPSARADDRSRAGPPVRPSAEPLLQPASRAPRPRPAAACPRHRPHSCC